MTFTASYPKQTPTRRSALRSVQPKAPDEELSPARRDDAGASSELFNERDEIPDREPVGGLQRVAADLVAARAPSAGVDVIGQLGAIQTTVAAHVGVGRCDRVVIGKNLPAHPFNYPITGRAGYPRTLRARADGTDVEIRCHIWPPRYANNSEYRLLQRPGEELQGFYVYRADRLLQIGGWNNVTNPSPTRRLARVEIDVDSLDKLVQLNPEKSGTQFLPEMARAINRAKSSKGITFPDFLTAAEDVHTASKKRRHRRARVVQPAQGFSPGVRKAIASELLFNTSEEPVSVKWRRMTLGKFFDIDRDEQTLWLNLAYRDLFSPGQKGMNDAPMIKTLMFLLTQGHFTGVQYSAAKKDDAAVWQALLGAAAEEEASRQRRQEKNS